MVYGYENLNVAYGRSREVMRLLISYDLLYLHTMQSLVRPAIKQAKLRDVLLRILKKGFIFKRIEQILQQGIVYYEISKRKINLKLVVKFMNVCIDELKQPQFGRVDLLYLQFCAVWRDTLRHLYPNALVVFNYKMAQNNEAKKLLQLSFQEKDIYPDLLLVFPKRDINSSVGVAIEIEKGRRNSKILSKKIKRYTNLTLLDGVLYVCEKERISSIIMDIYRSKVMPKSYRIQYYEKNFFVLSCSICAEKTPNDEMFNGDSESVLFPSWVKYLREVGHYERENISI